ncbi:uncharacterized protein [Amphiura filiformis]|uniref:uncharacterized protein n=1 Tax=Amphiura filiformis TaxID=82378 RepID=UPI003B21CCDF
MHFFFLFSDTSGIKEELEEIITGQAQAEENAEKRHEDLKKELQQLPARLVDVNAEKKLQEDNAYLEDVKQQLSVKYTEQYCSMQFIPSTEDQRTTDDIFVAPEMKLINKEPRDLSGDDLFSLKIRKNKKKHTVIVGGPGSGKSTLVHNGISYDWGRGIKHQHIKLLFVIDMYKIKPGSDLFEIIKDQLLRGEDKEKFEKLMEDNAQSTAFILDGFDEVSKEWETKGRAFLLS